MADQNAVQLNYDLAPSPQVASQLQQQFSQLEKNLRFKGPFGDAIKTTRDFGSELDRANQRVITLGASFAVLAISIRTLKEIAKSTIEVEKAFTEINAVFGLSARGLDQFSKQLFDAARSTGQSFERAADAAKEFSRQGLTAQETIRRTTDALVLTRLANLDVAKSVETLTASINGFQKSALTSTELVNKLATVDAKFAVSSADLAEALSRSGAAASDAGVSFDQLIGLITSAQQTTARGGAVIGNALKTIFTRVEQRGTIEAFRALGVEVEDSQGQMLKAIPLLQNFAATYDTLNDSLRKQAAQMVGGTYQINILKALLSDVAKANGAFAEATRTSAGATDEAVKRNEALNQSLDSMLAKLGVTAKQIGSNIGSLSFAGPLKGLIGLVQNNPITAALEDASGKAESTGGQIAQGLIKGIGAGLLALSPLVIKAAGKVALTTFKNLSTDFSSLAGISTESQTNARVQAEIVALYRAGGAALQQQLAAMSSIAERAALVQRLLNSGASNTGSFAAVTQAVIGQGYRGRGYPRAAEGYIPFAAESAAIAAGVGGAPKGSRPVYLPTFNRGGGQRGIVANTSEFIVPGAAGGAIFNRDMIQRYGLPPGATPVAAGGYIPHAADNWPQYQPHQLTMAGSILSGASAFKAGTITPTTVNIPPATLSGINTIFANLSKLTNVSQASGLTDDLLRLTKSLDKVSKSRVMRDYSEAITAIAYPANRARQQAIRAGNASTATFDEFGAFGPPAPNWRQRNLPAFSQAGRRFAASRLAVPQNAAVAAAFALPFAGSLIDEGRGGTTSGVTRGVLSGGLSGAGFGASAGLLFGPLGAAIGGAGGLLFGGVYGAIKKMSQSFEELATEINEANAKIQRQVEFVRSAYSLQQDVINAIQNGASPAKVNALRQGRTQALFSIQDEKIRKQAIDRINDPNGLSDITDLLTADQRKTQLATDLRSGTRRVLDAGGAFSGYSDKQATDLSKQLLPALQALPRDQLLATGRLKETQPGQAFANVLASTGVTEEQIKDIFKGTGGTAADLMKEALRKAFHSLTNNGILQLEEKLTKSDRAAAVFGQTLTQLASQYRLQARLVEVNAQAFSQVVSARQAAEVANPNLLDREKVRLRGFQEQQNIYLQSGAQRQSTIEGGRATLIDTINRGGAKGADSEAFRSRIAGLRSLGDFSALQATLGTDAGRRGLPGVSTEEFQKQLAELIETLKVLNATEEAQTKAAKDVTAIQENQLRIQQSYFGARREYGGAARISSDALRAGLQRGDTPDRLLNSVTTSNLAGLENEYNRRALGNNPLGAGAYYGRRQGIISNGQVAGAENEAAAIQYLLKNPDALGAKDLSGDQITSGLFGGAKAKGIRGDSTGSFLGGFRSSVEGAKHDLADFSDAGRDTFESLRGNATSFWQEWVTGAKSGKDAFKGFVASVASDASRMFANKAFTAALSAIPGFGLPAGATGGEFTGKAFHFAGGGKVPAMLTGGELFIGPQTARRIGYDKLRAINGGSQHLAGGGMADVRMVRGGSGVKDDVPANLPSGSFIVKKSTAQRLGPDYFRALAGGRVQHRFLGGLLSTALGGALTGAAVGGGLGYLAGGKKGAIGGALLGGIGGGLYGWSASNAAMAASAQGSSAGLTSYVAPSLSIGAKAALGLGASAGLGLLAGGLMAPKQDSGPIGLAGVPAYRAQLEAEQMAMLSKRKANEHAFLQINPQGGYSLAGLGLEPATRRWSEGGSDVVMPTAMPSRSGGGGEPQVYIKIDVNNQGGTSSSASKNGGEPFGEGSAGRLEKVVKGWVKEEIVRQSEPDGFFSQRSRYVS